MGNRVRVWSRAAFHEENIRAGPIITAAVDFPSKKPGDNIRNGIRSMAGKEATVTMPVSVRATVTA